MTKEEANTELKQWFEIVVPKFLIHMTQHIPEELEIASEDSIIMFFVDYLNDILFECEKCLEESSK